MFLREDGCRFGCRFREHGFKEKFHDDGTLPGNEHAQYHVYIESRVCAKLYAEGADTN